MWIAVTVHILLYDSASLICVVLISMSRPVRYGRVRDLKGDPDLYDLLNLFGETIYSTSQTLWILAKPKLKA